MCVPFPHFNTNGTPSQRSLLIFNTADAKVGVLDPFGTVLSSE